MIAKRDVETLYDYSYWANGKLFQVLSQLTPEQFTRPLGGGHESIRSTLVHALSAEWGLLERCGGPPRGARLDPNDYPTLQSVIDTWSRVEGYVREFLSKMGDDDLARNAEYPNPAGEMRIMPVGELMHHAANHAVHHR